MQRRFTSPRGVLALILNTCLLGACADDSLYVEVVDDNALADGFDFPVEPGEMDGWRQPPEADEAWDASSYLVWSMYAHCQTIEVELNEVVSCIQRIVLWATRMG